MAINKYLDEHGLDTLVKEIKKETAKVYKVKGNAIFADSDYLNNPEKYSAIDSTGIWQLVNGEWTKITLFEVGWVYNIHNQFTTDNDFIEGAGNYTEAGTNIVVAEATVDPVTYKWDRLGNVLDVSDYQTRKLTDALSIFSNELAIYNQLAANLPNWQNKANTTVTDGMIAILSVSPEIGDVYKAHVIDDPINNTKDIISWTYLGNQTTVEGALTLLGNVCPNTPITDDEIAAMFN